MKILILEDSSERVELFRKWFIDHEVSVAETAELAIEELQSSEFDLICLDHDLGDEVYVSSTREDTGAGVARWLARSKYPRSTQILIHSLNEPGSENIRATLVGAKFANVHKLPFTYLVSRGGPL